MKTLHEVSAELNINYRALLRTVEQGLVPAHDVNGEYMFDEAEFENYKALLFKSRAELQYRFAHQDEIREAAIQEMIELA